MRYRDDKEALYAFLERTTALITRESDRESLMVQMWLEEGEQTGRLTTLREMARTILKKRFPRVSAAHLKDIQSVDDLRQITDELLDARTAAEASRIITRRTPA